jgi:hypothetical protein
LCVVLQFCKRRQVGKAYYSLLEALCNNHTTVICLVDTPTFTHLVCSLEAGLKSLDVSLSSQCAAALDNLASFACNHQPLTEASPPAAHALQVRGMCWMKAESRVEARGKGKRARERESHVWTEGQAASMNSARRGEHHRDA